MGEWRVGRKLGRTLYCDEVFVGLMETRELAAEVVETMNRVGRLLDEVRGQLPPGAVWVEPGRSFAMNASGEPTRMSGRERSHAEQAACGRVCYCGQCRPKRGEEPQPPDAQRRSEATPQKDLLICKCPTECRCDHGLSRVDPYDTTKGGITE